MPDTDTSVIPTLSADREALLTQLVAGPSITEVATRALQPALDKLYPHLKIDPRLAVVVTPTWMFDGPLVSPGPRHFESLTDALVHHGVAGTSAVYLDGETFLTHQPEDPQPAQLPVSIDAIARLINELEPVQPQLGCTLESPVQLVKRVLGRAEKPWLGQRSDRHGPQPVPVPGKKRASAA